MLYDLQDAPHANSSGDDIVTGDNGVDVILGQDGNDRLKGNAGDDYIEGDQGSDWAEGNAGEDDLVGGSSTAFGGSGLTTTGQLDGADALYGGANDDVITGDNALVLRTGARTSTTDRLGSIANTRLTSRNITLFDLNSPNFLTNPPRAVFGGDRLSGGSETDVIYGQDGNDQASGGPGADYMEGNGGADIAPWRPASRPGAAGGPRGHDGTRHQLARFGERARRCRRQHGQPRRSGRHDRWQLACRLP